MGRISVGDLAIVDKKEYKYTGVFENGAPVYRLPTEDLQSI